MNVREADLPGIGRKFQADLRSGERIVVVVHDDGRRELYLFGKKDLDRSLAAIGLDDDEARQIAGILGGMAYAPRALETVDMALGDLLIEWYRVDSGSPAEGRTIGEMGIRQNLGVTVVAIIGEDGSKVVNPGPEASIGRGATLVVVGERQQVNLLRGALAADGSSEGV